MTEFTIWAVAGAVALLVWPPAALAVVLGYFLRVIAEGP
jgi:hypothetical protein